MPSSSRSRRFGRAALAIGFALSLALPTSFLPAPATAVNGGSPSSPIGPNGTVNSVVAAPGGGFYVGGAFTHWGVQTGGLGAFDATQGDVNRYFPWVNGVVEAIVSDGNGGWFIGGRFDLVGGLEREHLAHIAADGTVTPFAPTTNDSVLALALVGTTLFVGGRFDEVENQGSSDDLPRDLLAAVNVATGEWLDWDPELNSAVSNLYNEAVFALHSRDDILYVGGNFGEVNTSTREMPTWQVRTGAAAFDTRDLETDDGLSSTWVPDFDGPVLAFANVGSVLMVGGEFTEVGSGQSDGSVSAPGSVDRMSLAEIWPVESVHPGYATQWSLDVSVDEGSFPGAVWAIATRGAEVFVGGGFSDISLNAGQTFIERQNLFVLNNVGPTMLDPAPNGTVNDLVFDGEGNLYVAGTFTTVWNQPRVGVARLGVDFSYTSVEDFDAGLDSHVQAIALNPASPSTVILAGHFEVADATAVGPIVKVSALGARDLGFNSPVDPSAIVRAMAIWNGKVYAGRDVYDHLADEFTYEVRSFDTSSGAQSGLLAQPDGVVYSIASTADQLLLVGDFQDVDGEPRSHAFALDATDDLTAWAPSLPGPAASVITTGGDVYIGGEIPGGIGDKVYLSRTSPNGSGSLDGGWTPNFNPNGPAQYGQFFSLAPWNGNLVVGGRMMGSLEAADDGVALQAFTASAPAERAWVSSVNGRQRVLSLLPTAQGLYVGGQGSMAPDGASPRWGIALYSTPGTLADWSIDLWESGVQSLAVSDGVIAMGGDLVVQSDAVTSAGLRAGSPRFFLGLANAFSPGGGGSGGGGGGGSAPSTGASTSTSAGANAAPGAADPGFVMRPGEVGVRDDGVRTPVTSAADPSGRGIVITGLTVDANLLSTTPLGSGGTLQPPAGSTVWVRSSGWAPGSSVNGYALSTPTLVGATQATTIGSGTVSLALPAGLAPGAHTLQLSGTAVGGASRIIAVGINVLAPAARPTTIGSRVTFALGSAAINPRGKAALRSLARQARELGPRLVISSGALRARAANDEERSLAKRRALAVAAFLEKAGIGVPVEARVRPTRVTGTWVDRRVDVTVELRSP